MSEPDWDDYVIVSGMKVSVDHDALQNCRVVIHSGKEAVCACGEPITTATIPYTKLTIHVHCASCGREYPVYNGLARPFKPGTA